MNRPNAIIAMLSPSISSVTRRLGVSGGTYAMMAPSMNSNCQVSGLKYHPSPVIEGRFSPESRAVA